MDKNPQFNTTRRGKFLGIALGAHAESGDASQRRAHARRPRQQSVTVRIRTGRQCARTATHRERCSGAKFGLTKTVRKT